MPNLVAGWTRRLDLMHLGRWCRLLRHRDAPDGWAVIGDGDVAFPGPEERSRERPEGIASRSSLLRRGDR